MVTMNLEQAMARIKELEEERDELLKELEYYRSRKTSGRKKHNEKWMSTYNDFVVKYESGMTLIEIANSSDVSQRTLYRYKAYYDGIKGLK